MIKVEGTKLDVCQSLWEMYVGDVGVDEHMAQYANVEQMLDDVRDYFQGAGQPVPMVEWEGARYLLTTLLRWYVEQG